MKRIKLYLVIFSCVCMFVACKTNENNYRAAYEVAKQKSMGGVDSLTYEKMRQEAMPVKEIVDGDTIRVMRASVRVSKLAGSEEAELGKYNVVISQFRQVFNAKAMCGRLNKQGYQSFIIENSDRHYFVVAGAFSERSDAVALIEKLNVDQSIVLKSPYPCILEPINL